MPRPIGFSTASYLLNWMDRINESSAANRQRYIKCGGDPKEWDEFSKLSFDEQVDRVVRNSERRLDELRQARLNGQAPPDYQPHPDPQAVPEEQPNPEASCA